LNDWLRTFDSLERLRRPQEVDQLRSVARANVGFVAGT
jgi:hypothetical protein